MIWKMFSFGCRHLYSFTCIGVISKLPDILSHTAHTQA